VAYMCSVSSGLVRQPPDPLMQPTNAGGARRRAFAVSTLIVTTIESAGCLPLPIPHVEQVTPQVIGRLSQSNGAASIDVPIALTATDKDTVCAQAAVRTATDSVGAFRVPFTEQRKRIYWLTLAENPGGITAYWVCAGTRDSTGEPVYHSRTFIIGHKDGDTLDCLDWMWREERRVTCNNDDAGRILTGGGWVDGVDSGTYRVILAEADRYGNRARGLVQWIIRSRGGGPDIVRAMTELPAADDFLHEWGGPTLAQEDDHWYLTVLSARPTKWGNKRRVRFQLGPPGQVREVPASRH
jgi:hypothetical protein